MSAQLAVIVSMALGLAIGFVTGYEIRNAKAWFDKRQEELKKGSQ
jgi:hypothetical protein